MWWGRSWVYEFSQIEDLLRSKIGTKKYIKLIRKITTNIKLKI